MLIVPPKGVSGPAISTNSIKQVYLNDCHLTFIVDEGSYYWENYPSDTDMEEEFRRVCNEVNSILAKPTIQI